MVWETDRRQAAVIVALRAVRADVPVAALAVGRLIVDEVVFGLAARQGGGDADWSRLWYLVAVEAAVVMGGEAAARASSVMESLLG
ncbi:ABC transporter ATP-binding protein, partial [bacterium]|nr:ABC transporter ATP-binding protein [bacterium]